MKKQHGRGFHAWLMDSGKLTAKCEPCGKRSYLTRKNARGAARIARNGQQQYRCPHDENLWHNGHLPPAVKEGRKTRHELYGSEE